MKELKIFSDGGSRGNPGPAATGVYITDVQDNKVVSFGNYLGETTNNVAEYTAIIEGLQKALELEATHVDCYADSKLLVEQLNRNWKVKDSKMQKLFVIAYNLLQKFEKYKITHIRRELNTLADAEVNIILDARI
jgi:ribonuclease HI